LLVPVTLMKGSLLSLRLAILASGLWWLVFSVRRYTSCAMTLWSDY
jgi:hypothetical protein